MNILVLNYEYPPLGGGAAPVSRDISEKLAEAGNKVTLVTMGFKGLPAFEIVNGVEIHRLKCWRSKKSSCMPWEQYTYIMAAKKFLSKELAKNSYDVCHTHFIIPTGEVSKWVHKKYNLPVVITAHGSDVEGYNSKKYMRIMHIFLRPFWKQIVNETYKVISPSKFLEELMLKAYNRPDEYFFIPNGIDVKKYSDLQKQGIPKKKTVLLMGRMQKYKNMQTALMALSKLDLNGWEIKILGDGPYRPELEKLVEEKGLAKNVKFFGWVENGSKQQMDILAEASIYITASEFENCPMSVLETIAAGCYPLLSDIRAHRQLVPEEEFYFEPHDVDGLANKLSKYMANEPQAFNYDLNRYDWKNVLSSYSKVLKEAAEKGVKRKCIV
ncbi:glycosyltransferase family 4 protein [Butyrivibrio sp. YAB3001]|uniref:glycosyltransferase family 4 protein n=1 Tax=Butyrivibrio sp. YAB3001 TaxID=1520812 RepID=UPI0008F64C63|nr:glycosyltransferase family 4 protein [Butyrivibrio sp. YAB3001]SFC74078.1 Glycosyltransferase involved in cell wall bisynthesis [Butyrivibrio sp. YAB3001]